MGCLISSYMQHYILLLKSHTVFALCFRSLVFFQYGYGKNRPFRWEIIKLHYVSQLTHYLFILNLIKLCKYSHKTNNKRGAWGLFYERRKKKETKYSLDFNIMGILMKMKFKNLLISQLFLLPRKIFLQLSEHVLILYAGYQKSKSLVTSSTFAIKCDSKQYPRLK